MQISRDGSSRQQIRRGIVSRRSVMSYRRRGCDVIGCGDDVTGGGDITGSVFAGQRGEEAKFGVVGHHGVWRFAARVDSVHRRTQVQWTRYTRVLGASFGDSAHALSQPGTT